MSEWRHFKRDEFACKHCGRNSIVTEFVDLLDELREKYGKPLVITSGYRCPAYNAQVSSTGTLGPHTTGRAADLAVDRRDAYEVLKIAMAMGFRGIGINQKGDGRFLHLDMIISNRPTIWSY